MFTAHLSSRLTDTQHSHPGIKNRKVSTALSGFAGKLAIFFLVVGIGKLVREKM